MNKHKETQNESKIVKFTVRPTKDILNDFATTLKKARKGKKLKNHTGISFESIDGLRNVLTKRRLELISIVRHKKPRSIYQLSKLLRRDLKSVNTDLKVLTESDFVKVKRVNDGRQRLVPEVSFNNIKITVQV